MTLSADKTFADTSLGRICIHASGPPDAPPVVFLHGIYLDSSLWSEVAAHLPGYRLLMIDMPGHGESAEMGRDWTLDECATMLLQVLDAMGIPKCDAVGHSWGAMTALRAASLQPATSAACNSIRAMTALRAASLQPDRFNVLCLCNMPFRRTAGLRRAGFHLQKFLAVFRNFYAAQAAKALYTPSFIAMRPRIAGEMKRRVASLSRSAIARVIDAVILGAGDTQHLIESLVVPTIFVVGQEDYVGAPPGECLMVPGGHISPHEAPRETARVVALALATHNAS